MRRRRAEDPGFLVRPEAWWRAQGSHVGALTIRGAFPAYAGMLLARLGALREDEVERLERIAAGVEQHPGVDPEQTRCILARWRAEL